MKREWSAHQRSGQITVFLMRGNKLSTAEIARLTQMTYQGARYMMEMLSLVLPITYMEGKWRWAIDEFED